MAEFKVDKSFSKEIDALRNRGNELLEGGENLSTDGLKTLPTLVNIERQRKQIWALLQEYSFLVEKDANDLEKMMENVTANDQKIAQGI